ncbi:hypothetical protein HZI73_00550 [Vallitalea pronyensis]|uniref:Uncharacterized protein n=1 Tax=Vallitalea pronyensis TaxID=1348613 RepID=A0A8J8MGN4_9FIRM|nr:hypothetical protein [Vallitalea pronyensis]QUI20888.1 hypothetical protein HZI73_00550 [Vallitalea pronyensis]
MDNENDHIEDVKEWMEHQYDLGHYMGGNILPAYRKPTKKLGIFLLISGLSVSTIYSIIFIKALSEINERVGFIVFSILAYGVCILQIIGGIRILSKVYTKEQIGKIKKRTYIGTILTVIAVSIGILILSQFRVTEGIEITSVNQFKIRQVNLKNYVYVKDKELKCNQDDYGMLWEYKVVPTDSIKYIITYQYYTFNPTKGKIISIEEIQKE